MDEREKATRVPNFSYPRPVDLGIKPVVSGKKLGRKIGIPTCSIIVMSGNLEYDGSKLAKHNLITGVYFGSCRFEEPVLFPQLLPFTNKVDELF